MIIQCESCSKKFVVKDADIPNEASGYCQCYGGIKQMMKRCSKGEFRNCNEACRNGKFFNEIILRHVS